MLGLILIFFIGKHFYNLAFDHEKSPWKYAILGVVVYYAGGFIVGIILAIIFELTGSVPLEERNELTLNMLSIPVGFGACWLFHIFLQKRWSGQAINSDRMIDEIGNE